MSENAFVFPCKHMRSKEMYYQTTSRDEESFSSGLYWCARTDENVGPDGELVEKLECNSGRTCFEE